MKTNKLWGSAFTSDPLEATIEFCAGHDVTGKPPADQALLPFDIWLNKTHTLMLLSTKIITNDDAKVILKGLNEIEELAKKGEFILDPSKEDVHSNIESWLIEKHGIESCGKIHTARSRNDQIATDMRLYLRQKALEFADRQIELIETLLELTKQHKDSILPGFTHHQHAMHTTFGHILAGFAAMFTRDLNQLINFINSYNESPLGGAASYGTSFAIDRELTAKLLAFDKPTSNSFDPIMNRGEAEAGFAFALNSFMNHASQLAQTLILFSTPQFDFVTISDAYSTGSSIMPQKKNPDPLEVIKGKTSFCLAQLTGLLSTTQNSFLGYNRDSQWTKYMVMDLVSEVEQTPLVLAGILTTLKVNTDKLEEWSKKGLIGATHLLEQISINHNIPFRKAKQIVEKSVKYSQKDEISHNAIKQAFNEEGLELGFSEEQIRKWQDPFLIILSTTSQGGPNPIEVSKSYKQIAHQKEECKKTLLKYKQTIHKAQADVADQIQTLLSVKN